MHRLTMLRVINTFRTMATDEDVLEKEDMYILDKIKDFASSVEVSSSIAAAKQLVVLIDRVVRVFLLVPPKCY